MSLYLFLGDRKVPVNGELETGNQQNTWPTGSFSGRMVLVKKKSIWTLRIWELISIKLPAPTLRTIWIGPQSEQVGKNSFQGLGCTRVGVGYRKGSGEEEAAPVK